MAPELRLTDARIVKEELSWHFDGDEKMRAYALLSAAEARLILKHGFLPRELFVDLAGRLGVDPS